MLIMKINRSAGIHHVYAVYRKH